jgi:hypothetical protein
MKNFPETPAAIQAKLAYFRNRKAALDELIHCLERYTKVYQFPSQRRRAGAGQAESKPRRLAGAA